MSLGWGFSWTGFLDGGFAAWLTAHRGWLDVGGVWMRFVILGLRVAFVGSAGCCSALAQKVACSGGWSVSVFWLKVAFIGVRLGWLAFGAFLVGRIVGMCWMAASLPVAWLEVALHGG